MHLKKDNRLHVVHIIPTLRFGGAERTVVDIVNHANPERFRFSIVVFSDDMPMRAEIARPNVHVIVVPKRGKLSPGLVFRLTKTLRRLDPDIVHTHLFGADVWGRIAARELRVPMVTTEHNINIAEGRAKHWIKRRLRGYSHAYAACSMAVAEYTHGVYGVPESRIRIVRPGIDLPRFARMRPATIKTPVRFLILGRLTRQKGHRLAIHALSHVPTKEWRLTIAGDGEDRGELMALVRRLGLSGVITFVPATREVAAFYKKHDAVLIPSLWEGLGIVAMEGMAAGRLVVGAKTGGLPEVIQHKKTGLLFERGNMDALADTVRYVAGNARACETIIAVGREYAAEHFGVEAMVEQYEEMYTSVVSQLS